MDLIRFAAIPLDFLPDRGSGYDLIGFVFRDGADTLERGDLTGILWKEDFVADVDGPSPLGFIRAWAVFF